MILTVSSAQPVLGISHFILEKLRIPRTSTWAYLVHLTTAFIISAFFHVLSLSVVCEGYLPLRDLITDMSIFFLPQPLATIVETTVISLYKKLVSSKQTGAGEVQCRDLKLSKAVGCISTFVIRCFGYLWVFCWFVTVSWWFVKAYLAIGILAWPLPYSILEKAIIPGK